MLTSFAVRPPSGQFAQSAVPSSGVWSSILKVTHKEPRDYGNAYSAGIEDTVTFRTYGKETKSTTQCCDEVVVTAQWKGSALMRILHGEDLTQRDTWSAASLGDELTIARRIESESGASELALVCIAKQVTSGAARFARLAVTDATLDERLSVRPVNGVHFCSICWHAPRAFAGGDPVTVKPVFRY